MTINELSKRSGVLPSVLLEAAPGILGKKTCFIGHRTELTDDQAARLLAAVGYTGNLPTGGNQSMSNTNTAQHAPVQAGVTDEQLNAEAKAKWDRDPAIRAEFGSFDIWAGYHKADRRGKVKTTRRVVQGGERV